MKAKYKAKAMLKGFFKVEIKLLCSLCFSSKDMRLLLLLSLLNLSKTCGVNCKFIKVFPAHKIWSKLHIVSPAL